MEEYNIGILTEKTYSIKRVDSDYCFDILKKQAYNISSGKVKRW